MRQSFDVIIVGAGPAAVAALSVAREGCRTCVVTGTASAPIERKLRVHPKIRAVAYERREAPGLADFLPFSVDQRSGLFSTAALGGLASYWGQQFVRYLEGDPWPAESFASYADYEATCSEIEAMFALTPVSESESEDAVIADRYTARRPRLLVGTQRDPRSGLYAMSRAFQALAASRKAETTPLRAVSHATDGEGISVLLSNGDNIRGARLIIAAGVMGTLRLAMNSCPELTAARFTDHSPYMLYTYGLDRILRLQGTKVYDQFNALTIERIDGGRSHLFASVYRMSRASFSLLLSAVGLPLCCRGWPAPPLAGLLKPVQIWTGSSKAHYLLDRKFGTVTKVDTPEPDADEALGEFVAFLKGHGVLLRVGAPEPSSGFHYHAVNVTDNGVAFTGLRDYFDARFAGRIVCVDASALSEIGCRPLTLTAMASAKRLSNPVW